MEEDPFMPKTYLINWIGLTVWTMKAYLINGELDRKMETRGDAEPWTSGLPLESRATWLVPWLWSWRRLHGRPWVRRARVQGYMVASIAALDVRNGRVSVSGQPPHCNMEGSLFFFPFLLLFVCILETSVGFHAGKMECHWEGITEIERKREKNGRQLDDEDVNDDYLIVFLSYIYRENRRKEET